MNTETKTKFVEEFEQIVLTQGRLVQIKKAMESLNEETFAEQENAKVTYGINVCNRFAKVYSELAELIECIEMTKVGYKLRAINS